MPLGWNENARRALYSMEKEKTYRPGDRESTKDDGTQRQCSRVGYREKKQRTNQYNRQRDGERVDWQSNVAASPYTAILLGSN